MYLSDGVSGIQLQSLGVVLGALVTEGDVGVGAPRVDILGGQHCGREHMIHTPRHSHTCSFHVQDNSVLKILRRSPYVGKAH